MFRVFGGANLRAYLPTNLEARFPASSVSTPLGALELDMFGGVRKWRTLSPKPGTLNPKPGCEQGLGFAAAGAQIKTQAWIVRRLISLFGRFAKRPHRPRQIAFRRMMAAAGMLAAVRTCVRHACADVDGSASPGDSESTSAGSESSESESETEDESVVDEEASVGGRVRCI